MSYELPIQSVVHALEILADPTRRRLVEALKSSERSVGELVETVDIGQTGVSKQLSILRDAGFVRVRPEGRYRVYSLRSEPFAEIERWARGFQQALEAQYRRLDEHLEEMKQEE